MILTTEMGLLEYEVKGKGPDVLFFHGGHSNCYETLGVNSLVESGFRLIVPSRPGYGNTSVNLGKTPEEFADSVINIMIDQDIDTFGNVNFLGCFSGDEIVK